MKKSTRRFLSAMGSILDISPATDYMRIAGGYGSDMANMRRDAINISGDFTRVIDEYESGTRGKTREIHRSR